MVRHTRSASRPSCRKTRLTTSPPMLFAPARIHVARWLVARAGVSFALFMVMGAFMEFLAQTAYAFAHQRERTGEQSDELSDERSTIQARHADDKPHRE